MPIGPCSREPAVDRRGGAGSGGRLRLDLDGLWIRGADLAIPVTIPAGARESFLSGTWDATGLLLEDYEEVEAVAARLPYMR